MDLTKREDLPPEVIETLQKMFPGFEVKFSDEVDLPLKVVSDADQTFARWRDTLEQGLCRDCQTKMPIENWTPDQEPTEGWHVYETFQGEPACLICPECEMEAENETL